MPIAILKFKLPEEQNEFDLARRAGAYQSIIEGHYQYLRSLTKYGPHDAKTPADAYGRAFDDLLSRCREYGVDPVGG